MKLLEGKLAIITGASRGIGSGIAKVFAQHGANVAFTYSSSAESALVLENELNALGIKAKGYKSNAADFNEAQKLADDVLAEFGTIDILINNAGITKDNLLMRMSEEDFDKVIALNPKDADALYNRGLTKLKLDDAIGAITDCNRSVDLAPKDGEALFNRGLSKFNTGDRVGACDDWKKAALKGHSEATKKVALICNQKTEP